MSVGIVKDVTIYMFHQKLGEIIVVFGNKGMTERSWRVTLLCCNLHGITKFIIHDILSAITSQKTY